MAVLTSGLKYFKNRCDKYQNTQVCQIHQEAVTLKLKQLLTSFTSESWCQVQGLQTEKSAWCVCSHSNFLRRRLPAPSSGCTEEAGLLLWPLAARWGGSSLMSLRCVPGRKTALDRTFLSGPLLNPLHSLLFFCFFSNAPCLWPRENGKQIE